MALGRGRVTERFAVAIVGSRHFYPDDDVMAAIERLKAKHAEEGLVVVTRDQPGVCEIAAGWAKTLGVPYIVEPTLQELGAEAGHESNRAVVARAKLLIAYPHDRGLPALVNTSSGTIDAIAQAVDAGIPVHVRHDGRWLTELQITELVRQMHEKWRRMGRYAREAAQ
jgi:hypothetical protein